MATVIRLWLAAVFAWAGLCGAAAAQGAYADWAAVVVAADWRAQDGSEAPIFDNARRDVTALLLRQGFRAENIVQATSASQPDPGVPLTSYGMLLEGLETATARARGGCLLYITSHGSPQGVVFGRSQVLSPERLNAALTRFCADRPTVAIVSACFSGVFVPALAAPNRMVLTAARPDRSSFGCGNTNRYPYFDECVLQVGPRARDFPALGEAARECVAMREAAEGLSPPSEPQLYVGDQVAPLLSRASFSGAGLSAPASVGGAASVNGPAFSQQASAPGGKDAR